MPTRGRAPSALGPPGPITFGAHPAGPPLGVRLASVAKTVSRAFDDTLAAAGGSRPVWLVLMTVRGHAGASQEQLARQIGIKGATLTHHLAAMEAQGLVTRSREPDDRRNQTVRLRPEGERLFEQLRQAAQAFDQRLRDGLDEQEVALAHRILTRLETNVTKPAPPEPTPDSGP